MLVQIRKVPDETAYRIGVRAAIMGMSREAYLREMLTRIAENPDKPVEEVIEEAHKEMLERLGHTIS